MAMTRGAAHAASIWAPSPFISAAKPGKAGVDRRAVVDRHRFARGQAQHQEGHGDAMVEMRRHQAAARRRRAGAVHDQIVGAHLVTHAVGQKAGRDARQPVAFLGAQLGQAQHARRALGAGGGDGEDGIFVDHRGRALGRHLDAFEAAALDMQVGHRLAAHLAGVLEGDVGAHLAQGLVEPGAQRIDADILDRDVAARPDRTPPPRRRPPTRDRPAPRCRGP